MSDLEDDAEGIGLSESERLRLLEHSRIRHKLEIEKLTKLFNQLARQSDIEEIKTQLDSHLELEEEAKRAQQIIKAKEEEDKKAEAKDKAKKLSDRRWQVLMGFLMALVGAAIKTIADKFSK